MDPFLESMLNEGGDNINCNDPGGQPSVPLPVSTFTLGWSDSHGADSSSTKGKKKKGASKTSRKTWKTAEEELLMSAWLNVSKDSIVGTDQLAETYWGNIVKYCEENATANWTPRSEKGLINHWQHISADSSKFAAYMAKANEIHPSGTTLERIAMAMKMFKEIEGRSFGFLHLWSTLSQHPKWCAHIDAKRQKTEQGSSARSSAAGVSILGVPDDVISIGSRELPRPIGRDAARKARARGACGSTSSGSMGSGMYKDELAQLNKHKAELVELWRKEVSIKRHAEEDKIMAMDISTMDEASRDYFSRRKTEIIARVMIIG